MIKKILIGVAISIAVVVIGLVVFILSTWKKQYKIPYPPLQASKEPSIIARGKYLVYGPAHCSSCHVSSFKDLILSDQGVRVPLQGGVDFSMGPLGHLYPPNLTPDPKTGIGRYVDGQLFRMLRHAVKPDGTAAIPMMMPF